MASGPAAGLTARQESMILHHFWPDEVAIAQCMHARDFDYVPDPDHDADQLATVAALLEIEPGAATAPLPAVMNARAVRGLDERRAHAWEESVEDRVSDGGCDPSPQLLSIDDEGALAAAIASARADAGFEAFVAQALALEGDPVAQLRSALLVDGAPVLERAPQAWAGVAERIEAAVSAGRIWIVSERLGTDAFVDLVGLTGEGEALMVRVAADAGALLPSAGPATGPVLECGPHLVQVAVLPSADRGDDEAVARDVLDAIAAAACLS